MSFYLLYQGKAILIKQMNLKKKVMVKIALIKALLHFFFGKKDVYFH